MGVNTLNINGNDRSPRPKCGAPGGVNTLNINGNDRF